MSIVAMEVGPLGANCYLVGDEAAALAAVVDPGGDGERVLRELEDRRWRAVALINTHGHVDHIGANRFLKEACGCPLMIHEAEADALTDPVLNLSHFGLGAVDSPPADRLLRDGDRIPVGGLELEVIHTPGHSPGGISLLLGPSGPDEAGAVLTGDTLFAGGVGRTDFPGGSMDELLTSIRTRLLPLPDRTRMLPGHGPPSTIGEERRSNPFLR